MGARGAARAASLWQLRGPARRSRGGRGVARHAVTLHAQQIVDALRAGKHVFCEKPLSLDLAECERVLAEAARYPHLQATIGFMRRFDPSYGTRSTKSKRARSAGRSWCARKPPTRTTKTVSSCALRRPPAGIFLDCTVHDIDVARWLLGKPHAKRVFAAGAVALHEGLREFGDVDNGVAICEFEDGKLAMFYASRTQAHGNDTHSEVIGTAGALAIGRNPRANRVEIYDAPVSATSARRTFSTVSTRRFCTKRARSWRRCRAARLTPRKRRDPRRRARSDAHRHSATAVAAKRAGGDVVARA